MSEQLTANFIPVLSSEAGSCLTFENWRELGIESIAYYLDTLLMKPGSDLLNSIDSLRSYLPWQGKICLNASLPSANKEGVYTLRSSYDGRLITISSEMLYKLFVRLQPDQVVLPVGFTNFMVLNGHQLPHSMQVFFPWNEYQPGLADFTAGHYFYYDKKFSFSEFLAQIKQSISSSIYVAGDFSLNEMTILRKEGVLYIESDAPANDALNGKLYIDQDKMHLLDKQMQHCFQSIDMDCGCPTCRQKLTKAYLHHLYLQTPLLCHRFLIQHNVHYYKNQWQVCDKLKEIA